MSKRIQGVSLKEFDVVGGRDDLENYLFALICDDDWEIPDCFLENHSIWGLATDDLEFEGYVLILEDLDGHNDAGPGLSFGRYGLRLEKPRSEVRDFSRRVIMETCHE